MNVIPRIVREDIGTVLRFIHQVSRQNIRLVSKSLLYAILQSLIAIVFALILNWVFGKNINTIFSLFLMFIIYTSGMLPILIFEQDSYALDFALGLYTFIIGGLIHLEIFPILKKSDGFWLFVVGGGLIILLTILSILSFLLATYLVLLTNDEGAGHWYAEFYFYKKLMEFCRDVYEILRQLNWFLRISLLLVVVGIGIFDKSNLYEERRTLAIVTYSGIILLTSIELSFASLPSEGSAELTVKRKISDLNQKWKGFINFLIIFIQSFKK